jgi:hypothetical protein
MLSPHCSYLDSNQEWVCHWNFNSNLSYFFYYQAKDTVNEDQKNLASIKLQTPLIFDPDVTNDKPKKFFVSHTLLATLASEHM